MESAILAALKAFLLNPDVRHAAFDAERARIAAERQRARENLATVEQAIAKIDHQLGKLLDATLLDTFPADQIRDRSRALTDERMRLLADRERGLATQEEPVIDADAALAALTPTVEAAFAVATPDELRRLLDLLRVEVRVIDRNHVRLTGLLESIVTLSSQ